MFDFGIIICYTISIHNHTNEIHENLYHILLAKYFYLKGCEIFILPTKKVLRIPGNFRQIPLFTVERSKGVNFDASLQTIIPKTAQQIINIFIYRKIKNLVPILRWL